MTFILILNIHFFNYDVPPRAYTRDSTFNNLELTSSESTVPCILAQNWHFSLFMGRKDSRTRGKAHRSHVCAPLPKLPPPPHIPLIPCQSNHHTRITPFWVITWLWQNVPLAFCKIISPCTHIVFSLLFPRPILFIKRWHAEVGWEDKKYIGGNLRVSNKGDIISHILGVRGPFDTPGGKGGQFLPYYFRPELSLSAPLINLYSLFFSCLYLIFLSLFARIIASLPQNKDPIWRWRRTILW